jgi:hypothetical protein
MRTHRQRSCLAYRIRTNTARHGGRGGKGGSVRTEHRWVQRSDDEAVTVGSRVVSQPADNRRTSCTQLRLPAPSGWTAGIQLAYKYQSALRVCAGNDPVRVYAGDGRRSGGAGGRLGARFT